MADESKGERIMTAVETSLEAAVAPVPVFRSRTEAFSSAEIGTTGVLVLTPDKEDDDQQTGDTTFHTLNVEVAILKVGVPPIDKALDPLKVLVVKTLRTDPALGALVMNVREAGKQWTAEESDGGDLGECAMKFTFTYSANANDPAAD